MKNILYTIILSFLFSFSVFADWKAGLDAYNAGDFQTALKNWIPLAEQGYANSQYSLGLMYVEQGFFQSLLALIVDDKQGVLQDNVYAHMWANIAANQGNDEGSKLRDELEEKMTSDDISQAQNLASECITKNYKGC